MRPRHLLLALAAAIALASPALALRIAMPNLSTSQKVTQADVVVVGKVSLEKDTVDAAPYEGAPQKVPNRVAVINIETALSGAKNLTAVKVLFADGDGDAGNGGRIKPLPVPRGMQPIKLTDGQEGVFFLTKHATAAGFYQIQMGMAPLTATDANYKDELAKVKATATTVSNPVAALKVDSAEDRLSAVATLAMVYRSYPRAGANQGMDEVPLPTEESKLILKALKDADWTKGDPQQMPANVAAAFGLVPGQYGMPVILPKAGEDANAAVRTAFDKWYAKYGESFELTRFVPKGK